MSPINEGAAYEVCTKTAKFNTGAHLPRESIIT